MCGADSALTDEVGDADWIAGTEAGRSAVGGEDSSPPRAKPWIAVRVSMAVNHCFRMGSLP